MKNIGIIFGHGDNDPGACSEFGKEAEFVRELQPFILAQLAKYRDIETTVLDTNRNWFKYLANNSYNFKGFDYILELHANSGVHDPNGNGATTGTEIWVTNANQAAKAKLIVDAVASAGFKNRSVKTESFRVIRIINNQGVDASLLEVFFVGDKDDVAVFNANKQRIGAGIADALAKAVGVASNAAPSTPMPEQPKPSVPAPQPAGADTITLPKENASWRIYNENGPYTTSKAIGALNPQKFGGLTYDVVRWVTKGEVAIIDTADFGRVGIYVHPSTGAIIKYASTEQAPQQKKTYIQLGAENATWRVYNVNGPYTSGKEVGKLAPAQFGGLEYEVIRWIKTNEIAVINTQSFGQVAIYVAKETEAKIVTK